MRRCLATTFVALVWFAQLAVCQTVTRAFVMADGKMRLTYANGSAKIVPPEPQQVECEAISFGKDQQIVGWSVLVPNCCTSYPVAAFVVIYQGGKKTVISTPQMIYQWHFVADGKRVAVLSGPVHGWASTAGLYDARKGKLLSSWYGEGAAPKWAAGWKKEFQKGGS
jgi:hypothetical protein